MKRLQLHPACKLFPELPDAELQQLADDIKANGVRNEKCFGRFDFSEDRSNAKRPSPHREGESVARRVRRPA